MSFPRGRGRIVIDDGHAILIALCPLCGAEHRYEKGNANGPEIEEIRRRGFSDEWLPCQLDLPGNFWRVSVRSGSRGKKGDVKQAQSRKVR